MERKKIMDDYVRREDVIKAMNVAFNNILNEYAQNAIKNIPAADVVEIGKDYSFAKYKVEVTFTKIDKKHGDFRIIKQDKKAEIYLTERMLVRCKDCKWYRYHDKQCVKNGHHGTKLDDYCSYGERNEQEYYPNCGERMDGDSDD